jgi:hypothetical protein
MVQLNAPTHQPIRFPRAKVARRAKGAHGTVTDVIARPALNVPNKVTDRNRLLRQQCRSSSRSHAAPISRRTIERQLQRYL